EAINICPTREITASSGQIRSPNYPSNYSSNTSCILTIKQPLDTNFTFTFTKLDIESDEDELTCYDYLIISGGSSETFCGTTTPAPFVPGLNVVTLEMVTDGSIEQSGFDLSFTTIQTTGLPPAVSVCPTRSINPSDIGRVHSPGFAGNYGANLNCKLTLDVPSNKEVEISYNFYDIELDIVGTIGKTAALFGILLFNCKLFQLLMPFLLFWLFLLTLPPCWLLSLLLKLTVFFKNIWFTDEAIQCSKDKLTVADNSGHGYTICGHAPSAGSPDTYNDSDVSFHFTTDGSGSGNGFILTYKLIDKPIS
ncbi:Hypothetical predicted protein, partial [Paramuricea clavata]